MQQPRHENRLSQQLPAGTPTLPYPQKLLGKVILNLHLTNNGYLFIAYSYENQFVTKSINYCWAEMHLRL